MFCKSVTKCLSFPVSMALNCWWILVFLASVLLNFSTKEPSTLWETWSHFSLRHEQPWRCLLQVQLVSLPGWPEPQDSAGINLFQALQALNETKGIFSVCWKTETILRKIKDFVIFWNQMAVQKTGMVSKFWCGEKFGYHNTFLTESIQAPNIDIKRHHCWLNTISIFSWKHKCKHRFPMSASRTTAAFIPVWDVHRVHRDGRRASVHIKGCVHEYLKWLRRSYLSCKKTG